mmetsp:Transcript_8037/g.13366  ORF Transcript_8037/g.13366 Transcript_8037/m.13366 type:complete len:460 (+) Transcript_8037:69-1448(+)
MRKSVEEDGSHASQPLLDEPDQVHNAKERNDLYWNFVIMCLAFSANHGCVVSCLAYATTELGDLLGGYGSGTLYVCYALTAFLFSKPLVEMVGPKFGLFLGVFGYCVYVGGFLVAVVASSIAWPVFLGACAVGGTAGGLLWTAQGKYFAANSLMYASASDKPVEETNAEFAGIFAMSYLGLEMITKLLATGVFLGLPDDADAIIFTIYSVVAVLCAFVVSFGISDLDKYGTWDFNFNVMVFNVKSTGILLKEDVRLLLMVPFQVAFGFASSFVPYYIFGTVIADSKQLGDTYVGLLSALIVFTGASIAIPSGWIANRYGKHVMMVTGGLCLMLTGMLLYFINDHDLGTWKLIIPYLIIYGTGRGTWENTNKAVIADLYIDTPDLSTAAFAAVSFSSGVSGAFGYFVFESIERNVIGTLIMMMSLLALICYLSVNFMEKRRKKTDMDESEEFDKFPGVER